MSAEFRAVLPAARIANDPTTPPHPDDSGRDGTASTERELRITLIDGGAAFAELLQDALRLIDARLPTTVNAFERAIPVETLAATEPSIVIIDPRVGPGTEGWELVGRAQATPRLAGVPVIICGADAASDGSAEDTSQLLRLPKPFDLADLEAVLRHAGIATHGDTGQASGGQDIGG